MDLRIIGPFREPLQERAETPSLAGVCSSQGFGAAAEPECLRCAAKLSTVLEARADVFWAVSDRKKRALLCRFGSRHQSACARQIITV